MKCISLTMPQLMFIVATRAALVGLGAVTTVPAAGLVFRNGGLWRRRLRILAA